MCAGAADVNDFGDALGPCALNIGAVMRGGS